MTVLDLLLGSTNKTIHTVSSRISSAFPKAVTSSDLVSTVSNHLARHGLFGDTLLATSICCDEVCRPFEEEFKKAFGPSYFSMGGLAGFPFGGLTGFKAMASHIPDGGSCLLVYGPHVGVNSTGVFGTIERRGCSHDDPCCGSACAACAYVHSVQEGGKVAPQPLDALDAEQYFVGKMLLPYGPRLGTASDTMVELSYSIYDAQDTMVNQIVSTTARKVAGEGKIALVGGILINTPDDLSDYFMPMRMEVRSNTNEVIEDMLTREGK